MANFLKSLFVKGVEIDTAGAITGDVLKYNGTKFGAASAGGSAVAALNDLTDVVITTPAIYETVVYNGSGWVNSGLSLSNNTSGNYVTTITAGTGIATSGASTGHGIDHSISLASGVATIGTYKSVTVDTYGRVTAGTNPTTLAGYGITDAQKAITISDTAPVSPAAGDLWYKSDTGAMYIRYDSFWIEVGSPSSGLDGGSA